MFSWVRSHRQGAIHAACLLLPLLLLYVHGKDRTRATWISLAVRSVAAPGQAAVDGIVRGVANGWQRYVQVVDAEEHSQEVAETNRRLSMELALLKRRLEEAERQARLCGFRFAREDLHLLPARVVAHELGPLDQVVRLALELPEGAPTLPVDASVVTARGLVGRVAQVSGRFAEVQLITDPRAHVHARAGERGVLGTVKGVGAGDRFGLRFQTTEGQARLAEGDPVVTSGHDRRYTPGLVIGVIASSEARQQRLRLEYAVRSSVPFWEVREVFVVAGTRTEDEQ